jgi:hypothetical protein
MIWNGNECGKIKVMEISRQPFPVKHTIDQKKNWRMWIFSNIYVAYMYKCPT